MPQATRAMFEIRHGIVIRAPIGPGAMTISGHSDERDASILR
jgi:hypothetical protein